jgi:hypothetical protein
MLLVLTWSISPWLWSALRDDDTTLLVDSNDPTEIPLEQEARELAESSIVRNRDAL